MIVRSVLIESRLEAKAGVSSRQRQLPPVFLKSSFMPSISRSIVFAAICIGILRCGAATNDLIFLDPICQPTGAQPELPPGNPSPSTRKMAALLKNLDETAKISTAAYYSERAVQSLSNLLSKATNLQEQLSLRYQLGIQQMQAGRPDFALNSFHSMEKLLTENDKHLNPRMAMQLRMRKATAFLRLGEQENCLANHNAESCLFPLRPKAFHLLPRGARAALELFEEQLAENPKDLGARWLLNIAYMALGEYPAGVPSKWLLSPSLFASEFDLPRFPDVADKLKLDVDDLAGGTIVDDFDNDGFLDVVASSWDMRRQLRFFRNNGDGTFTERTSEAGLVGITSGLNLQQTDFNNDGFLDIFLMRGAWLGKGGRFPNSLLKNNGDGTFTDVTEAAGLMTLHPTQTCEWFDFDGDGWLDLFIGNETSDPKDPDWCELFRNNRDGTFTECARASGISVVALVKGVTAADFNNDGRPDLYLSVRNGPNLMFRNEGPRGEGPGGTQWWFTEVTRSAGVQEPVFSFPTWAFDYDNDGDEDLFCSGYYLPNGVADVAVDYLGLPGEAPLPKLYRNNGDGSFTDVTTETHLNRVCHTMGCNFGDLDNDGWLDFYLGTGDPDFNTVIPNRMFRNAGGKFFQDVTTATGTGHLQKGHGVAFADIDNDGDQDVYIVMGGAYTGDNAKNALFLNPGNSNAWLKLKLVGTKANRAAIGARVKVTLATPGGPREIHRRVTHGASFGANPLRLEIGLGDATAVSKVEIRWPGSETRQTLRGFDLNRAYEVHEDASIPAAMVLKPIRIEPGNASERNRGQASRD